MFRKPPLIAFGLLIAAGASSAQIPTGVFSRPPVAEVINPVVGHGAKYETVRANPENSPKETQEMSTVAKDKFEGKDAFWIEFGRVDSKTGKVSYGKVLFTASDMQFHRVIVQSPGQAAMEVTLHSHEENSQSVQADMKKYREVGSESVTTPAGTFDCKHWKKNASSESGDQTEIWTSPKVTPFGIVKQVSPGRTMVLVKLITDAVEQITGPVKAFDPENMKRQLMEKMQQKETPPGS